MLNRRKVLTGMAAAAVSASFTSANAASTEPTYELVGIDINGPDGEAIDRFWVKTTLDGQFFKTGYAPSGEKRDLNPLTALREAINENPSATITLQSHHAPDTLSKITYDGDDLPNFLQQAINTHRANVDNRPQTLKYGR